MKNKATKILSLVFAIMMVLSTLSVCSVSSFAEDSSDDVIKGETIWAPNLSNINSAVEVDDKSAEHVCSGSEYYYPLASDRNNDLKIFYYMRSFDDENPFLINIDYVFKEKAKLESDHYYVITATASNACEPVTITVSYTPEGSAAIEAGSFTVENLGYENNVELAIPFKTDVISADSSTITINASGKGGYYCNLTLKDIAISSNQGGHTHSMLKNVNKPATCEEDGYEGMQCEYCDKVNVTKTITANGHTLGGLRIITITPSTCTTEGKGAYLPLCEVCGETYGDPRDEFDLDLAPHSFTNYVSNNDATCTKVGTKTAKCDNCDKTKTITDEGSKLDHSFTNYVSNDDATCTADGTKTAKCDNCDAIYTITDEGSATGHADDDGNGYCDKCNIVVNESLIRHNENAKLNYPANCTLNYKTKVTVTVTATGVEEGYHLEMCINGNTYCGTKDSVTCDQFELTEDTSYGIWLAKDGTHDGKMIQEGGKITCKAGFFQKLIAFFKGLFGSLPTVAVKP